MVAKTLDPPDHPTQTKRQVQLTFSETCRQTTVTLPGRGVQPETTESGTGGAAHDPETPVMMPLTARLEVGMSLAALRVHQAFKTPSRRRVVVNMHHDAPSTVLRALPDLPRAAKRAICPEEGRELGRAEVPQAGRPTSPGVGEEASGPKRRRRGPRGKGRTCRNPRSTVHEAEFPPLASRTKTSTQIA